MSVSEKLGDVPVEGLTWGKLIGGLAAFTTLLVGAATLFTVLVVPIVLAEADQHARAIARDEATNATRTPHRDAVTRRELDDHKSYAAEQFALLRADIKALTEVVRDSNSDGR
jgi:hypothetical protein